MAVGTPSANPSGGLAFGYTFTLTDNFTAAAEKIALSFIRLEEYTSQAAKMVSGSIATIKASQQGLSQVTTQVNRLASAFERLGRARKQAQGVAPSQIALQNLATRQQNADTRTAVATGRASAGQVSIQAAAIRQATLLANAQNAQATATTRNQAAQVTAQNRLQNALQRTGVVGRQAGETIDRTLGSVMRGLGTMFLGASLFKPLLYAIDVNDEFEKAHVRLKGLLGSDSAAKSVLKDVKMDAKNDFLLNSKDLLNANANLISEGASVEQARKISNDTSTLVQVGGGTVQGYTNAILALMKTMGSDKVFGQQVNRLNTARIPITKYYKEFKGKSIYGKSGKVETTKEELFEVLQMAAEKYRGIAEDMRNTVTGLKSMVSEGATYIMAEFGKINAVIYKQLLRGLDAFLTKLMIFSQTPIGNVVVKLTSAALAFAAISTTALGLYQVIKALGAALAPMMMQFVRMVVVGYAIYQMLQSNSTAFIALGVAISIMMGGTMVLVAAVNLLWRAWQTFNDVTEESYQKMSPLNQMFARWGGYLEAFGEILSTINGDSYLLSESLVMKLKSIGAFENVLKIGNAMLKIYNAFVKIYEIGKWVAGLFDGWGGYAVVMTLFLYKLFSVAIGFGSLLSSIKKTVGGIEEVTSFFKTFKWAGPTLAAIGLLIAGFLILYATFKHVKYLFENWDSLNFGHKLLGIVSAVIGLISGLGLLVAAINSVGAAFGVAAVLEYSFLAPILLIVAAVAGLVWGLKELYEWVDSKNTPEQQKRVDSDRDNFYSNPDLSFVPNSFDPSTDPTTKVRSLQYQTIGGNNEGLISSAQGQDINVNVHYDGDLIYRSMQKKGSLEDARGRPI